MGLLNWLSGGNNSQPKEATWLDETLENIPKSYDPDIDNLNAEVAERSRRLERGCLSYEEFMDFNMKLSAACDQGYTPEIGDDGTVYLRRK